jgi:protocatechuate 3,4-dioxygenase beta subunit
MRWFPQILLLSASIAVAQNPPPDADQKKIRIAGAVFTVSGEPLHKTIVRLQRGVFQPGQQPVSYSESTSDDGTFAFEDVVPGRYTLTAAKVGFLTASYGARSNTSPGTQLNLTAGMELKDLVLKMTPQGVIIGKVVDQDGDPVAYAQIQAMHSAYVFGRKRLQISGNASTNDLGEYRIANLAPGRYYVTARDEPYQPERARGSEAYVTTYYPNGADAANAVPVDIAAGGEIRGMNIRLLRAKVYTIRGRAVDESGASTATILSVERKEDGGILSLVPEGSSVAQVRPDGSFEVGSILPGTYVIQVGQPITPQGQPPAKVTGRVEVTVGDGNVDGLVLPIGPCPEITGTITVEDGDITAVLKSAGNTAYPPAVIEAMSGIAGPVAFALARSEIGSVTFSTPMAQIKEDGTFRFSSVGASKYLLVPLSLPQGMYVKSASFGGQDVMHEPIDTTSGKGGTLDLVLSSKAGDVAGSVLNEKGEAQPGMVVSLWPKTSDGSPTGGAQTAFTDQGGGFRFSGLAPGEYYVAAWEDLDPGLAQSADFLGHFTSEASAVKLSEGGQWSADLKPVPSGKILVEMAKLP